MKHVITILLLCIPAFATTRYVAQTAGTFSGGTNCNGQTAITPATWNSTSESAGDITWICGTITFSAGASGLTVPSSGSSGNPILINFDTNAILEAPYFGGSSAGGTVGGAIVDNGKNYITIDGKNTGIIENTLNGSSGQTCLGGSCSDQEPTVGVFYQNTTGLTIQNLTIQDMYINCGASTSCSDSTGQNSADIEQEGSNTSTVIQGNTLKHSRQGFNVGGGGTPIDGLIIANNVFNDHAWHLSVADGDGTATMTGTIAIYGNTISNFTDWQYPTSTYHQDGLIAYTASPETYTMYVYNNYFQGNGGCSSFTAFISNGYGGGSAGADTMYVFNNIFDATSSISGLPCGNPGYTPVWTFPNSTTYVYNNTMIGNEPTSGGAEITLQYGPPDALLTSKNNVYENANTVVADYATSCCTDITAMDYDDYYGLSGTQIFAFNVGNGTGPWYTLATLQSNFSSLEPHAITSNPNLNGSYVPNSGSALIGAGVSLYSTCNGQANPGLGALCSDYSGNTRPSSGAWTIGALNAASGPSTSPAPAPLMFVKATEPTLQ